MIKATKYIAAGLIAGAMAACTSTADEPSVQPSPDKYICFGLPTIKVDATVGNFADTPTSRASSLTNSIGKFMVWGFCVPNNISGGQNQSAASQEWNDKSTFFTSGLNGEGPDVFRAQEVTNNSNGFTSYDINSAQSGNQYQKWNEDVNARYTFIAGYIPEGVGDFKGSFSMEKALQTTEVDQTTGKNKSHGPRLTYTLPHAATIDTVGITQIVPSNDLDALIAARFDHRQSDGRVNLSFFHFMTGLRFKFHNHTSDKSLVITRVIYKGIFHREVTFDFTTDDPILTVRGEYGRKFQLTNGSQTIAPGSADFMGGDDPVIFLMLPNPEGTTDDTDGKYTLGREKEIRIEYTIGDDTPRHFVHKNFTLNYIPQPNTLHTAHFNFIGDEFVVFFQADDEKNWENGSDNNVVIQ